jgi:hypothetical protein
MIAVEISSTRTLDFDHTGAEICELAGTEWAGDGLL